MFRNTKAVINLAAIGYNIRKLQQLLPEGRKMMGVVKADGYGHGSVAVARKLIEANVDYLMVALLEEAMHLRENGIDIPILVVGRVHPEDAKIAAEQGITLNVYEAEWIKAVNNMNLTTPLSIHIEFETGMNRTGVVSKEALASLVKEVKRNPHIRITGAFTHFATADDVTNEHYQRQSTVYEEMLQTLTDLYPYPLMTHTGNSAAGIQYPEQMKHYTRFGVSIYGLYPSRHIKILKNVELQEAFSLYSELVQVKKVSKGEYIGYGAHYTVEEDMWIGTVPIGYGDGWSRALQGFHVLVNGKEMPIIGRVCMDSMMIRLDQAYEVGEKVTLIGRDGEAVIEMDDLAYHLNTINYEIPCMLTSRIPRLYEG